MLVGSGVRLAGNPFRSRGGPVLAVTQRATWAQAGARRNWWTHSGADDRVGVPSGGLHPGSWLMPPRPGGMAARTLGGRSTFTATATAYRFAEASWSGSSSWSATAGLRAAIEASWSGSSSWSSTLSARLAIVATWSGSSAFSADASGVAAIEASWSSSSSFSAVASGTAAIEARWPFGGTELTANDVAAAVWAAARSSGGGDTMGEALRLALAIVRNRVVTDPAAGTYTVYDDDGVTVLLAGDLWQDAAGTVPYAGAGAERRDRLT